MPYFPSSDKLQQLGFIQREEHYPDFLNWTKHANGNEYYRITLRKNSIGIIEDIRLQRIYGHQSAGAGVKNVYYIGHFPSELFFDELLKSIGVMSLKEKYKPSEERLTQLGFSLISDGPYNSACWFRNNEIRKHEGFRMAFYVRDRVELDQMNGNAVSYPRFSGSFSSEYFFDTLMALYDIKSRSVVV